MKNFLVFLFFLFFLQNFTFGQFRFEKGIAEINIEIDNINVCGHSSAPHGSKVLITNNISGKSVELIVDKNISVTKGCLVSLPINVYLEINTPSLSSQDDGFFPCSVKVLRFGSPNTAENLVEKLELENTETEYVKIPYYLIVLMVGLVLIAVFFYLQNQRKTEAKISAYKYIEEAAKEITMSKKRFKQ